MVVKNSIRILIASHLPVDTIANDVFLPIQVGTATSSVRYPEMVHDDEGVNISMLNSSYCELTAIYWAWKNLDADYYGLCHYRRYFSFSDLQYKTDGYGNIVEKVLDKPTIHKYCLDDPEKISRTITNYDIITVSEDVISNWPKKNHSMREQYANEEYLHGNDFDLMISIIQELYPQYAETAQKFSSGTKGFFLNMSIMKKDLFNEYCSFLFGVLQNFQKKADLSLYNKNEIRCIGHLGERLTSIFILQKMQSCKILQLQRFIVDRLFNQEKLQSFTEDTIPIVMASNNSFSPMMGVCIQSIIEHANPKKKYEFIVLQTNIQPDNISRLKMLVAGYPNIRIQFFNPVHFLEKYHLKKNPNDHISIETYYRFIIPSILPNCKKALYLDCDLVVNTDIAELFCFDLHGKMIGAVRDPDFIGRLKDPKSTIYYYASKYLQMKDPFSYFQAGVLLFDLEMMRNILPTEKWLLLASEKEYRYNDQDLLNKYCQGNVTFLPMEWNCLTDCNGIRKEIINLAPVSILNEYNLARQMPKIVHFAGYAKPWKERNSDFAFMFWDYAKRSSFYDVLLGSTIESPSKHISKQSIINKLLPKGTRRRNLALRCYYFVRNK